VTRLAAVVGAAVAMDCTSLLAGCGQPKGDGAVYIDILRKPSDDPNKDLLRCAEILDADTRGDCTLAVSERAKPPGALCPQVPAGPWQDECWFRGAEIALEARDWASAITLCRNAGLFANDCTWHLWQGELRTVVGPPRKRDLLTSLPAARRLHDKWAERLQDGGDFELRYWRRYYELTLEVGPHLDINRCEAVPGVDGARCRYATAHLYLRRLLDVVNRPAGDAAFCAMPSADAASVTLALGVSATSHPLLDAVVQEQFGHRCTNGFKGPFDGVVTSPGAWRDAVEAAQRADATTPADAAPATPPPG
jgi:hypothetical protein